MEMARLDWDASAAGAGERRLKFVRDLLAVRRRDIIPRLAGAKFGTVQATAAGLVSANWQMGDGAKLSLIANLSDQDIALARESRGTLIWGRELTGGLPPWTVSWRIE